MFKDLFTFTVKNNFSQAPECNKITRNNSPWKCLQFQFNNFFGSMFLGLETLICNRGHYLVIVQRVWLGKFTQVGCFWKLFDVFHVSAWPLYNIMLLFSYLWNECAKFRRFVLCWVSGHCAILQCLIQKIFSWVFSGSEIFSHR